MSAAHTVADLEQLYHDVVLKQDFYGESYGSDWQQEPYDDMAQLLVKVLAPKRHVDVGCGKGFLVRAMRNLDVESIGVDYSEALIRQAPVEIRDFLHIATTEQTIVELARDDLDLITYMEVFEHLPIVICEKILQTLHRSFTGKLLITTPSFGVDERWKLGIKTNSETPTWQADMVANRPFDRIVLKEGLPHHGHISLCSYRWWTEFFLCHGWNRCADLEKSMAELFQTTLVRYNWNPYLLERVTRNRLQIDLSETANLGPGWHGRELIAERCEGRWTDGHGLIYLYLEDLRVNSVRIELSAANPNVVKDFTLTLTLEQQMMSPNCQLQWTAVAVSFPVKVQEREKRIDLDIPLLAGPPEGVSGRKASGIYRLSLLSPAFCPAEYQISTDARRLGLFVHKITVLSDG